MPSNLPDNVTPAQIDALMRDEETLAKEAYEQWRQFHICRECGWYKCRCENGYSIEHGGKHGRMEQPEPESHR